jgi:heat shock protein HspQ
MIIQRCAKFGLGQSVRHADQPFRGVVVDVDAECVGPFGPGVRRDQPFYQVLALGPEGGFLAYVPEESLEQDAEDAPSDAASDWLTADAQGRRAPRSQPIH